MLLCGRANQRVKKGQCRKEVSTEEKQEVKITFTELKSCKEHFFGYNGRIVSRDDRPCKRRARRPGYCIREMYVYSG